MYIIYTKGAVIVADSATAAANIVSRIETSVVSGEATALGVKYANGVALTYEQFDNLNSAVEIYSDYSTGNYEGFARDATGIAVGVLAAEIVSVGIAAGVGGAAAAAFAPLLVVSAGVLATLAAQEAWDAIHDMTQNITEEDVVEVLNDLANRFLNVVLPTGMRPIDRGTSIYFSSAQFIPPRRDPLTLDLDGDGLETVGVAAGVLFDHDGDGVASGTGWVSGDDGFLVLDRNGNGQIDNGRELFGDSTPLAGGGTALDGFAALAQEDSNADGRVDSLDANWSNLRVWRDLNQDGVSQAGELFTLASLGITALNVAATEHTRTLPNGNQVADLGSYVRSDGSSGTLAQTGQMADVNLADDTFNRTFTDSIPITPEAQSLPDMRGSGLVRDLREAASQSGTLGLSRKSINKVGRPVAL